MRPECRAISRDEEESLFPELPAEPVPALPALAIVLLLALLSVSALWTLRGVRA